MPLLERLGRSPTARTAALLVSVLLGAQLITLYAFCDGRARTLEAAAAAQVARELALLARLADAGLELPERGGLATWRSDALPDALPIAVRVPEPTPVRDTIGRLLGRLSPIASAEAGAGKLRWRKGGDIALGTVEGRSITLASVALASGERLNAAHAHPAWTDPWVLQQWSAHALTSALLVLVAALISRRVTAPLRRVAQAAAAFGRGVPTPLAVAGTSDARTAADAFNAMQRRIARLLEDRTTMLRAVGHDLRTPLTRLRLRIHLVEDDASRERLLTDVAEIELLTTGALELARGARPEEPRKVDLGALVEATCEDLADTGLAVRCELVGSRRTGPATTLGCRPEALRRAVANVVENGARHGGGAMVRVTRRAGHAFVTVEDGGPGVAPHELERVFEPFVRLEGSRSRATGGTGLGLALARTTVREHGGEIRLENRAEGGLRASIELPLDGGSSDTARSGAVRRDTARHRV